MTIPSTARRAGPYVGTGALVSYPFSFKTFAKEDLRVIVADEDGNEDDLVVDSTVLVTLNADQVANPGGSVQYADAAVATALPTDYTLVILSAMAYSQGTALPEGGSYRASAVEGGLDALAVQIQQIEEVVGRALVFSPSDAAGSSLPPAATRANRLLGFDSSGIISLNAPADGSAASLAVLLASYANASQGAGMIGYDPDLTYAANTIGDAIRNVNVRTPEQFGCLGDGATNDAVNFQDALDASAGGILMLTAGKNYRLHSGLTVPAGTWVVGYGATVSFSTSAVIANGGFNVAAADVVFEGVTFDQGVTRLPVYASYPTVYNAGIYADGATNLKVLNCNFTELYTQAVVFYQSDGMTVRGCKFSSPAQTQNLRLEHISIQTTGTAPIWIENNDFDNDPPASIGSGVCAIFASGTTGPLTIEKNRMDYCGRDNTGSHRLGVIDFYGNSTSIRVVGNKSTNCMAQWMRVADVDCGEVSGNEVSYAATAEISGVALSIESTTTFLGVGVVGVANLNVFRNTFVGNSDATRYGVTINSYDYGVPSRNIRVSDNVFEDFGTIAQVNGPFNNVRIERNDATGTYGSVISQQYTGGGIALTALNGVTQAQSFYGNLYVKGNVLLDSASPSLNRVGINLDMTKTAPPYTGTLGEFDICDNTVYSQSANSAQAILFNGIASANTARVYVRDNELTNYNYALYLRNALAITVGQNSYVSIATGALLESGNTSVTEEVSPAGSYTPTSTGVSNIGASLTPGVCQYQCNGKMVFVSGSFSIVQATAGLFTQFRLSLPFPAALGASLSGKLGGAGSSLTTNQSWAVYNNGTNEEAYFQSLADASLSHTATFSFMYQRT